MKLLEWEQLPDYMQNNLVKPYYEHLQKRRKSLLGKRILDLCIGIPMTIALLPIIAGLALFIKLDSAGPIFFRQERITTYGRTYRIYKFRTMVVDADKKGPAITRGADNRITRMGRLLRKCRLDELPQVFNVLTGDMSFVGTRPEVAKYVEAYSEEMYATLLLPAGITSRTSILYKDEDEVMEKYLAETELSVDEVYIQYILPEKMKHNLAYTHQFGVKTDLKIMVDTAIAVLK